ncbi:MAG TPA: PaaI family thioesterase [Xanthobacteraceae bacterium]|nr:PaaI family thioesterase [Xanthobacteraceae bacterium]
MDVPKNFRPIAELRTSPFLERVGPLFFEWRGKKLVLGLRIDATHANARGTAHGGLLLTLADVALGYQMAMSQDPPIRATTISMSADFIGGAAVGDWVEAHVEYQLGSRLAFANAYLMVGDKQVARASGVFLRHKEATTAGEKKRSAER